MYIRPTTVYSCPVGCTCGVYPNSALWDVPTLIKLRYQPQPRSDYPRRQKIMCFGQGEPWNKGVAGEEREKRTTQMYPCIVMCIWMYLHVQPRLYIREMTSPWYCRPTSFFNMMTSAAALRPCWGRRHFHHPIRNRERYQESRLSVIALWKAFVVCQDR